MILMLFGILLIGFGAYMFKKNTKTIFVIVAGVVVACLGFSNITEELNEIGTQNKSAYMVYAEYME